MARGANLNGRWGNGRPYESVRRTGFVQNTITSPRELDPPDEHAPELLLLSEPWYETPSRLLRVARDPRHRGQTASTTARDRQRRPEPKREIGPKQN
jgi:hypothetical protein